MTTEDHVKAGDLVQHTDTRDPLVGLVVSVISDKHRAKIYWQNYGVFRIVPLDLLRKL